MKLTNKKKTAMWNKKLSMFVLDIPSHATSHDVYFGTNATHASAAIKSMVSIAIKL